MKREGVTLPVLIVGMLVAFWFTVGFGSVQGDLVFDGAWIKTALYGEESLEQRLLLLVRLPRAIVAVLVGAALSLSGLVLQSVTRNSLADPYLLGISGGAALAVVLLRSFVDVSDLFWWLTPLVALGGASLATVAIALFVRRGTGRMVIVSLILGGVIVNAFCAALMQFLLTRFDPLKLRVTTSWIVGGIGVSSWEQLAASAFVILGVMFYLRSQAHHLNALALGEDAQFIGIDADRLIKRSSLIASFLAAIAVSLAGLLGYVGLIVPHAVRFLVGHDVRVTLPYAALCGGLFLLVTDGVARVVVTPEELPVGVITALIGCPVLFILLRHELKTLHRRS